MYKIGHDDGCLPCVDFRLDNMLAAAGDTFEKSKYTQHKTDDASTLPHSCVTGFEHKHTLQMEHLNANIWHAIAKQLKYVACITLFNTTTNRAH